MTTMALTELLPRPSFLTQGACDFLLLAANMAFVGWFWFLLFRKLIKDAPLAPRLRNANILIITIYIVLSLAFNLVFAVFLMTLNLIASLVWVGILLLLRLARKKSLPWLSWVCAIPLALMVFYVVLGEYRAMNFLLASFNPRFAYKVEFGEFPSGDVREIQSTFDETLLDISTIVLKFHANRATFDRIKPNNLTRISGDQLQHGVYGGLLANYIRQGDTSPEGDRKLAEWSKQISESGREIWLRYPPNSTTEELMTYEPSSRSVEFYFFETE